MIDNKKKWEIAVHAEWVGFMLSGPAYNLHVPGYGVPNRGSPSRNLLKSMEHWVGTKEK